MLDAMRQNAGSWIVKILFAIIIIVFVFAYSTGGNQGDSGNAVIAYVEDTPILTKDFEQLLQQEIRNRQQATASEQDFDNLRSLVLSNMINAELLRQQSIKLGLFVSDEEVATRIRSMQVFFDADNTFSLERYRLLLQANGFTEAGFEASLRHDMLSGKLIDYITQVLPPVDRQARDLFVYSAEKVTIDYLPFSVNDFIKDIPPPTAEEIKAYYKKNEAQYTVPAKRVINYLTFTPDALAALQKATEDEIKAYFEANTADFINEEKVKARHILFRTEQDTSPEESEEIRKKALQIKERASKGEDFATLAEKYSEGPSASKGGDLGWFGKGAMVPEFEQAAFALTLGEVSQPIKTAFGWHLIKVEKYQPKGPQSLAQAREEIKTLLSEEKAAQAMQDMLDQGIGQIIVGDSLTTIAETLGMPLMTTQAVALEELGRTLGIDADFAAQIFDMAQGKALDIPVPIEQGYLLVENKTSIPAALTELEKVEPAIKEAINKGKARGKALERAEAVLAELMDEKKQGSAFEQYKTKLKTSASVGRRGFSPEFGFNPALIADAFAAIPGAWLKKAYDIEEAVILARPKEHIPPSDENWENQKLGIMFQLSQINASELSMAYLDSLRQQANIRILEPSLIDS